MKIAFFDIDGTLWDSKFMVPESAKEAIRQFRASGNMAFICSGRARGNIIAKQLHDIGFDGVLAACGNHVELNGEVLYEKLLNDEQVKKCIEVAEKSGIPIVLEGPKTHWISEKGFENDPYIDYLYEMLGDHAKVLRGYEPEMRVNKFSADVWDNLDYESIKHELEDFLDFIEHDGVVVEFIPKGTSKATGIKWLCEYLKVDTEDTYAFGDSINDKDMLEFVGHGVCMGNGTEAAKAVAEYITTDIHDDGIYNAMKHYNLI
ncbi:MAG: Cof-type HAD-IIB family hydrolase [Lachnospiraceae bacterium]|nr:Cof-type HAD-IIB family hydrolase [Lachnospiraceae bacterium]